MLNFILEYWIEVLFGILCTIITLYFRQSVKMLKHEREDEHKKIRQKIVDGLEKEHEYTDQIKAELIQSIDKKYNASKERNELLDDELKILKKGVLSIQGKLFKSQCEKLLQDNVTISLDQYEDMEQDYDAYRLLGGNGVGTALHDRVVEKFKSSN